MSDNPAAARAPGESQKGDAKTTAPIRLPTTGGGVGSLVAYSLTIFLSAFLLFQIQPLIGKFILPWFGGTPGVWTTCMLVFQILLFGGYLYAHLTVSRLSPRAQAFLHTALLLVAVLALPIIPNMGWKPSGDVEPISRIVLVLGATVGLPFFVLSATGPLLQGWFSRIHAGRSPYRLYALSNVGSLLALISFPVVFEWTFATKTLAYLWSGSFVAFAILCGTCAWIVARRAGQRTAAITGAPADAAGSTVGIPVADQQQPASSAAPSQWTKLLWFALAMVPSVLLLATTNQVCLDVASVPFLWVLPLTLYLLSFILCFDSDWWYSRRIMMPAAVVALAALYPVLRTGASVTFALQLLAYFAAFFVCAMVCHGELVRRKPDTAHLTAFYLVIAAGGAAGGIFVAVVAPLLFNGYYELHLGLFACAALMLVVLGSDKQSRYYRCRPRPVWVVLFFTLSVFGVALADEARQKDGTLMDVKRTFYGVLRVNHDDAVYDDADEPTIRLVNGRIAHGFEYEKPELRAVPTTYYSPESAIGLLLKDYTGRKPLHVGLVGLGIGTLATYARPGDHFQFYEINPTVERLARKYFHYLSDCRGKVEVILGDARLSLDRELPQNPQNFDVLVLDAFAGDAIPVHLLTVEAFEIYLRHMAPQGVIAVHISNRHFDLKPVVDGIAEHHHLATANIHCDDSSFGGYSSQWILVAADPKRLDAEEIRDATDVDDDHRRVLWTDNHASLIEVLGRTSVESLRSKIREWTTDLHDRILGAKKNEAPE
jgi:hypothetical protein